MQTKICAGCKEEKSIEDFPWKSKKKNQRQSRCRPCYRAYANNYYHNTGEKQKQIARVRKTQDLLVERFHQWKSALQCTIPGCGESAPECIDLHHTDPSTKEGSVYDVLRNSGSWNKFLKEVNKCVAVCSNCHRKIHSGRITGPVSPLASNQKKG